MYSFIGRLAIVAGVWLGLAAVAAQAQEGKQVPIRRIVLKVGESCRLEMSNRQIIQQVIIPRDDIVAVAAFSTRAVTITGKSPGRTFITLIGVDDSALFSPAKPAEKKEEKKDAPGEKKPEAIPQPPKR
jgi:hypothetical protein